MRSLIRPITLMLLLLSTVTIPVLAVPKVSEELSQVQISIGDSFEYRINAVSDTPVRFTFPTEELDLSPFSIIDRQIEVPADTDAVSAETLILTLSVYETGDFHIPSLDVTWIDEDGNQGQISSEKQFIRVKSILVHEEEITPKPLKGPVSASPRLYYKIQAVMVVILSVVLFVVFFKMFRRFQRKKQYLLESAPEPILPAHVIALEKLNALSEKAYLNQGKIRQFFIELSEITREYTGRRFAFQAMEHTTGEIRRDMKSLQIETQIQSDILNVLELSDMVKFAKLLPEDESCRLAMERVYKIIETTKEDSESSEKETSRLETTP